MGPQSLQGYRSWLISTLYVSANLKKKLKYLNYNEIYLFKNMITDRQIVNVNEFEKLTPQK